MRIIQEIAMRKMAEFRGMGKCRHLKLSWNDNGKNNKCDLKQKSRNV